MTIPSQSPTLTNEANNISVVDFAYTRAQAGLSLHCYYPVKEPEIENRGKESLNTQLVTLADQMHKYIAVNHFYYDAVEALFNGNEIGDGINEHSHYGLTLITHWLCEQDKLLLEILTKITSCSASMTDNTPDQNQ